MKTVSLFLTLLALSAFAATAPRPNVAGFEFVKEVAGIAEYKLAANDLNVLLSVDASGWKAAIPEIEAHYAQFGDSLPTELTAQLHELAAAL